MQLKKTKQGKLNSKAINAAILAIILVVVLFQIYAELVPEAQTAGNSLNDSNRCADVGCHWNVSVAVPACFANTDSNASCDASGASMPLGNLFDGSGFIFLMIMAALIILVVKSFITKGK